jgi:hypothetical protein
MSGRQTVHFVVSDDERSALFEQIFRQERKVRASALAADGQFAVFSTDGLD